MATIERATTVAAPTERVWAALADFASISAWAPNVDHSCLLSEQTDGEGMVRRIQAGRSTVVETVTVYEPEAALGYEITGLPPVIDSVTNTWTLVADAPTSTKVTLTTVIDAGSRPPQKAVARVVGRALAKASDDMLAGLTAWLEGDRS